MKQLSVRSLHKSLNENGYICDVDFSAKLLVSIKTKPVGGAFLYGLAGTGKSYLPMVLSEVISCPIYVHQCTTNTREDELTAKYLPSEKTKTGVVIEYGKLYKAALESKKRRVILMLDEWDKTRPTADALFLDFLQYGRLSIPGHDIQANLDNMLIFTTANDEREFLEALLRRLPKIDVQPLTMDCVKQALEIKHKGHNFLPHCLELYARCLMSEMPKPATIQELRQLMDAITELGGGADWDELVYTFVTKTPENHGLLKRAETDEINVDSNRHSRAKLNSKRFGRAIENLYGSDKSMKEPLMPRLVDIKEFESNFESAPIPDKDLYGVFKRTKYSEDTVFSQNIDAEYDPEVPSFLEWATITEDVIYLHDTVSVRNIYALQNMLSNFSNDDEGEVMILDEYVTRQELNRMLQGKWVIKKRDSNEIIARRWLPSGRQNEPCKIDLRYREDCGLEIVADIKIGAKLVEGIFKLNKRENLVRVMDAAECISMPHLLDKANHIVPHQLRAYIEKDRAVIGLSQIKALSKGHSGFCDMLYPKNNRGRAAELPDGEIDELDELRSSKSIKVSRGSETHFSARGIEVSMLDTGQGQNSGLYVKIDSLPDIELLNFAVSWVGVVPLYKCSKVKDEYLDGNLYSHLANKNGWSFMPTNTDVLEKNDIFAVFAGDYVVFCTFIDNELLSWSSRASALISNRIRRIKACVNNYCNMED